MPFRIYQGNTVIDEGDSPLTIAGLEADTDVEVGEHQATHFEVDENEEERESERVDIPAFRTLPEEEEEPDPPEGQSLIEPKHVGGGYYELSNGERVQGKEKAIQAENNL